MGDWQKAADKTTDVIKSCEFSLFSADMYTTYANGGCWGGDGTGSVIATFNKTTMAVTITTPQFIGEVYKYIPADYTGYLHYANDAIMGRIEQPWALNTDGILDAAKGIVISGTFTADGFIYLDKLAPIVQYHTTQCLVWDAFNTTWKKRP